MKCPNCQTENPDIAKFCRGCGQKLEAQAPVVAPTPAPTPAVAPAPAPAAESGISCSKCGAQLKAMAKFCPKCGTPVNASAATTPVTPVAPKAAPVPPVAPAAPKAAPVPPVAPKAAPVPPVPPAAPKAAPVPPAAPQQDAPKKKGVPVALIIILALIVLIAAALVVLMKLDIIGGGSSTEQTIEENVSEESTDGEEPVAEGEEAAEVEEATAELSEEELAKIMAPVDTLKNEGITLLENDNLSDGISKLTTAMQQYVSILQTHGAQPAITDNVNEAFSAYASGVINHVNILYDQELSPSIYEQMSKELTEAIDLAYSMAENGCVVDSTILESTLADLPANYKERYILTINELTTRESWSRSEAWAIMEGVDELGLFDEGDLDDPLRLRYAYSLAMYTRKMNDADIASGALSPRDAGMNILNSIEEMDYNPVMLLDASTYFKQAGENYTADTLARVYNEACDIIYSYQGLRIPSNNLPWERFWYFNDFGAYSVDDTNGLTPECRQAVREHVANALSSL